jgi:uracil-DNA glycosylase family protein
MANSRSVQHARGADSAAALLPDRRTLSALRKAAKHCEGCELFREATQTVFGAGRRDAPLFLLGEQPGDREDQQGIPFVGPAGILLRGLIVDCGVSIRDVYLTNAVKHFRWEPRGKRRLHAKPLMRHLNACRPWLEAELGAVEPLIIVCLGATAALAVFGRGFSLTKQRGTVLNTPWNVPALATYHPSAILRAPDAERRTALQEVFRKDFCVAARTAKLKPSNFKSLPE